jgi:hypothetical protein
MDANETGPPGNGKGQAGGLPHCAREESNGAKVAPPTLASQALDRTSAESFYDASTVKRKRRTASGLDELLQAVVGVLEGCGNERITIRHLFYRLVSMRVISKEEKSYQNLVKHLTKWRIAGLIPCRRFVDSSRWHYGAGTFDDAAEALEDAITGYRKNLWRDQNYHVEVWCEKEAIASIVTPVSRQWGTADVSV